MTLRPESPEKTNQDYHAILKVNFAIYLVAVEILDMLKKSPISVAGMWLSLVITVFLCPVGVISQERGLALIAREVTGSANFDIGKQYAVLIGIDRYQNWLPLKSAVAEAKNFKRVLAENYYIDEFIELYDGEATAVNIRKLFTQVLPAKLDIHDSLLVVYAGHGQLDESKSGFWIPVDGGTDALAQDRWLPNSQLRNYLGQLKAQRVLVMADSCFSGDLLNTSRGASPTIDSAYYKKALQMMARQVLSSGASETVPDESEFARQVLGYLERNTEPMIDTLSIFERIRSGMTQTLPMFGSLPGNENGASFVLFRKPKEVVSVPTPVPTVAPQTVSAQTLVDQSFRLLVSGPAVGLQVSIDGQVAGQTPVEVSLPRGIHTVRIVHPDWETWSGTIKPEIGAVTELKPELVHSTSWQIGQLQGQKRSLEAKLGLIAPTREFWGATGMVGWITAASGVIVSVVAYVTASTARVTYDAATNGDEATSARRAVETSNSMFQVSVLGGSAGLLAGLASLIFSPDGSALEGEIRSVDQRIQTLGGQK